jgi:hypothetical protein
MAGSVMAVAKARTLFADRTSLCPAESVIPLPKPRNEKDSGLYLKPEALFTIRTSSA